MQIQRLIIDSFRNLNHVDINCCAEFNIFYGLNGSGKTSILEAIYYLGFNRSFRSHINQRIIQYSKEKLTVFAKTDQHSIGIERDSQQFRIKLDNQEVKSIAAIAKVFPLQIIHPHTHLLLEAGPEVRRQFIDWGVFHVEHYFLLAWQRYSKVLKQRNRALREHLPLSELTIWDKELIETAQLISEYRKTYLAQFNDMLQAILASLLPGIEIELHYYQGWGKEIGYADMLSAQVQSDRDMGFTQLGPHRADLKILINKIPAKDALSRGQQKVFVAAMQLAQGKLLQKCLNIIPLYLIDDLPAELDSQKRELLCHLLQAMQAQVFMTCIEPDQLASVKSNKHKMFHVEHGIITPR